MEAVLKRLVCHLGATVLALAHAFAHVELSSSPFFPLPIHACVFTRMWSVGSLTDSVDIVGCTTLLYMKKTPRTYKERQFVISVKL